jgi:hypothetical protein
MRLFGTGRHSSREVQYECGQNGKIAGRHHPGNMSDDDPPRPEVSLPVDEYPQHEDGQLADCPYTDDTMADYPYSLVESTSSAEIGYLLSLCENAVVLT